MVEVNVTDGEEGPNLFTIGQPNKTGPKLV